MTSRAAKKIGRLSEYSQCHDTLSARAHIAGDGGENKQKERARYHCAKEYRAFTLGTEERERKVRGAPLRSVSMLQFLLDSSEGHCQRKKDKKAFRGRKKSLVQWEWVIK